MAPRSHRRIALIAVTLTMFVIICILSARPLDWPASHFNDMAILISGENFATHGFIARHLLPVYFIGEISDQAGYYTYYSHTPPLFHLFNGVLQSIGIRNLAVMRIVCGGLFIVGMLCTYAAFSPIIGGIAALCGIAFIGTTAWFVLYGTGLYDTLNFLLLGLFFLVFMRAVHHEGAARRQWTVCWLVLLLGSMNSYEFILYTQAFAWTYAWAAGRLRATWRSLVPLAAAPVAGVGLHFVQVVWALGWEAAWADGLGVSYVRGGVSGLATRWEYTKKLPRFLIGESRQVFFWPCHAIVLIGVLVSMVDGPRQHEKRASRPFVPLFWALLFASMTWFLAMPYAAVRNIYTIQQLVPLVLVVMGVVTALLGRAIFRLGAGRRERGLAMLAGVLLVFGQGYNILNNAGGQRDMAATIAEAIGPDAFPPKVGVFSNAGTIQYSYYVRRPWWLVPNMEPVPPIPFPESLAVLQKHLPPDWLIRYYFFASWSDPSPYRLLVNTCPGRRLTLPWQGASIVLFDISSLHLPPEQRPPLDPQVVARQLRGDFPEWRIPGFQERLAEALERHAHD